MPAPQAPEFRQRAVELTREGAKPVAKLAKDLCSSESCLRNWMARADADQKRQPRKAHQHGEKGARRAAPQEPPA